MLRAPTALGKLALRSGPGNRGLKSMPSFGVFAVSFRCPRKADCRVKTVVHPKVSVLNPHQVSKMSSLWRIEQSSVREFGKPDS